MGGCSSSQTKKRLPGRLFHYTKLGLPGRVPQEIQGFTWDIDPNGLANLNHESGMSPPYHHGIPQISIFITIEYGIMES